MVDDRQRRNLFLESRDGGVAVHKLYQRLWIGYQIPCPAASSALSTSSLPPHIRFQNSLRPLNLASPLMAKGSQLSQLKSALNQAGLTQKPQNRKKRKRSGSVLDDKEKERRAQRLREIQQKMNPFDVKVTKLKHDVGGRNISGTVGRPAQSKQAGIEQVRPFSNMMPYTCRPIRIFRGRKRFSRSTKRRTVQEASWIGVLVKMILR